MIRGSRACAVSSVFTAGSGTAILLCVLWYLPVAQCQQNVPYASFMGDTLPNHAYVNLSQVGEDSSDSVQCHTDLTTCCTSAQGSHRGDWIPPDSEMSLPLSSGGSDIYQFHGDQLVDLRRRNNADMPSGIYRCDIATNAVQDGTESVFVGLYYASDGKT